MSLIEQRPTKVNKDKATFPELGILEDMTTHSLVGIFDLRPELNKNVVLFI